jgi:hypothetical protein
MEDTLKVRKETHGSYSSNASVTMGIMEVLASGSGIKELTNNQMYGLLMIAHKMSRIVSGNPNEPDHWEDICGYAKLAGKLVDREDV